MMITVKYYIHNKKSNLYQGMKTHMHINLSRIYNWFRLLCESLWTCAWGLMYRVILIVQTRDTGHFLLQAKWQLKMMSQNCLQFIFAKSSGLLKSHLSNQVCPLCPFLMICFRLQRFTADFRDLTSWVTEMKALINADELANDVAGAEALLDRHQEHKVKSSKL